MDPSKSLATLEQRGIAPFSTDFYRFLTYQCADLYPPRQRRAMKNLIQSVYTHCELARANSLGTYYGTRLAELPPTEDGVADDDLMGIGVVTQSAVANIPGAPKNADVLSAE